MPNQIIFIVGPTAVGKSSIAIELSKLIHGEIVSCDAMQVYKEVPIASNQPSPAQMKLIPHHLIGFLSVEQEFDVVQYNKMAVEKIKEILGRQKVPVVCGGSGMYMQVLLDGIFGGSPRDEEYRLQLKEIAEQKGTEFLHSQLLNKDPSAASKIHPNDLKRIIRALEVCSQEGQLLSQLQKQREGLWDKYDIKIFGLRMEREDLYQIINDRVEQMVHQGLIEEIQFLDGKVLSPTAEKIIGIPEIRSYLKQEKSLKESISLMRQNTRHLAKRQMTWFRKEQRIEWIDVKTGYKAEELGREILKRL